MRFLLLFLCVLTASAADIIPSSRLVTWQGNVGVSGGIPSVTTIFRTLGPTATVAQVQSAITSCPSNQAVQLTAGTFSFDDDLDWQSADPGVVLRGTTNSSGIPTTTLSFSDGRINFRRNFDSPAASTLALTADYTKGSTTITAGSIPAWIEIGELYAVNETDDSTKIKPDTDEGSQPLETGRGMGHIFKVTAKDATTITTELPSPYTYRTANSAHVITANYNPATHTARVRCGIEDLNLTFGYTGSSTTHPIMMENADNCWIKNVHSTNSPGGVHVMIYGGYRCEVRHSSFRLSHLYGGGQGYGVAGYQGGAGHLIIDNEFYNLHVGVQMNYSVASSVVAYNYIHDGIADVEQEPGMNQHGIVSHQILWEGNWSGPKFTADDTHGSGGYLSTVFRNRIEGSTTNASYDFDRSVVNLRQYCRSFNVVGNVLGKSGYHTIYEKQATVDSYSSSTHKVIWVFGYGATGDDDAASMDVLRAMNYDVVTATNSGVVTGGFSSGDLVSSYWLPSEPSWFGVCPWPPFGPDVSNASTSMSYTNIPAGWRAANGGVDPPAEGEGAPPDAPPSPVVYRIGGLRLTP